LIVVSSSYSDSSDGGNSIDWVVAGAAGLVAGTGCAQIPDERRTRKKKRLARGLLKGLAKGLT
jgi:hypothetical protein